MVYLTAFFLGFIFSFFGSIPPGTLNMTVLQLGLENKRDTALRFAAAVAIVEYPYAWIGVHFEYLLSSSPVIVSHFELIASIVMFALAAFNLWPTKQTTGIAKKFEESGFRRGLILSVLNPMAIPYWMAFTAYMKLHGWLALETATELHVYVLGTSLGALALLCLLIFFAQRLAPYVQGSKWVKIIPGLIILGLGIYTFSRYLSKLP
jgi:threonine/homoserine/homoserine lactone efflux protein